MQIKNPDTGRSAALRMGVAMAVIAIALMTILGGGGVASADGPTNGVIQFRVASASVTEGQNICVYIDRSGGLAGVQNAEYTVSYQAGAVLTGFNTTLGYATFAAGQASTTIDAGGTGSCLTATDDMANNGPRTVTFQLTGNITGGAVLGTPTQFVLTILDNDGTPTYSFGAATYSAAESVGTFNVPVLRGGGMPAVTPATVHCIVALGTAEAEDITGTVTDQLISFAAGETSKNCVIKIVNDLILENPDETVLLSLSGASAGFTAGTPTAATVTIVDDDGTGTVSFGNTTPTVAEGTTASVPVVRTGGNSGALSATCTVSNGTAGAGDYTATTNQVLNWGSGDSTTKYCQVFAIQDFVPEAAETVSLSLSGAQVVAPSAAVLTITDNTGIGTVQFLQTAYTGFEADQQAIITLTRTNGTSGIVTVYCTTTGIGSAVPGSDYQTGSFLATFGNGESTATCAIPLVNDLVVEGPETLQLNLTSVSSGATIGVQQVATLTIQDNGTGFVTVTSVSPAIGPTVGGTLVTITGTNFTGATSVTFDGSFATIISNNGSVMTVSSPVHALGTVDVVVNTPSGSNTTVGTANDFTYTSSTIPVVTSVTPASGQTGTSVTILGSGFSGVTCPSGITFGGVQASATGCNVNSDSSITARVPSTAPDGIIDVRVTNAAGTSTNTSADNFNNTSNNAPTLSYTLISRFTLIGWAGIDNINVANALKGVETPNDNAATNDVSGIVTAIWSFDASTQTYKGYFPGSENVPGANDFTTLRKGQGYFIAINVASKVWTVIEG